MMMLRSSFSGQPSAAREPSPASRAFTLTELLVVIGIIAVLAGITVVGYRSIAKDAKLASGKNAVMAVLDNARAMAIKRNKIVMVVFRPRIEGDREQYIEAVLTEYTGRSRAVPVAFAGGPSNQIVDIFAPIPRTATRRMPTGLKVAGPGYGSDDDFLWETQSHLPSIMQTGPDAGSGEAPGELLAVMYASNGTVITRNPVTDSARAFVDFNNDGLQQMLSTDYPDPIDYNNLPNFPFSLQNFNNKFF